MIDSILTSGLRTPRRMAALALLTVSAGLSGCTGEPTPETPPPSSAAPAAAPNAKDDTPKIPGGKGDLMDGIPKK
ncbi:MAG: hypothetical protein U0835_27185 [Isosphaeraceae bacterium]